MSNLQIVGDRPRSLKRELWLVGATLGKLVVVIIGIVALHYGLLLAQSGLH